MQPRYVVRVRMRQHDEIKRAVPERQTSPNWSSSALGLGPAVHEDLPAVRRLNEDCVSLPHVEEPDVEPAIGQTTQMRPRPRPQERPGRRSSPGL